MPRDPIVEEVRKNRRELHAESGNDLHKYFDRLREVEKSYGDRVVDRVAVKMKRGA